MTNAVNNLRSRIRSPSLLNIGEASSKEPVQVEPKTYFANERTFIQWISAALLLLTVSSIMMGSGNYNGTSSVIAFCSLILVGYASFVYFRRVKLLRSGEAYGYLDFVGPSILAGGVGVGVCIVFMDAVKGSEFLPFGGEGKDYDDRRFLMAPSVSSLQLPMLHERSTEHENTFKLQEMDDKCSRYPIDGINLLEYQPRDITILRKNRKVTTAHRELIVATPQALVSHSLSEASHSEILSEIPDTEIQSMTVVGDRLFALSLGPTKTEVIEFNVSASDHYEEVGSRFLIQNSASSTGSMVFVDDSNAAEEGKLFIYLDGSMHSYHLPSNDESLSRAGSINMRVLNRGIAENDDSITAMEHFEGVTYVQRERANIIEAWDLASATLLAEMPLPTISNNDKWVGMAFERRYEKEDASASSLLRKGKFSVEAEETYVHLHMPLDTFPPQLWSFRLEEHGIENDNKFNTFGFPDCDGVAMN